MAKRRKKGSKTGQVKQLSLPLMEIIHKQEELKDFLRLLFQKQVVEIKHIACNIPILQKIIDEFDKNTDIPLEIPFTVFITAWSGYLNKREIQVKFASNHTYADIFNIVIAKSGTGKTYTLNQISKILDPPSISFSTSASFIKQLAQNPKGYIVKDEIAEFLMQLTSQTYMQELKEYILQLYSNQSISRITKKEVITVDKPVVSILGATVSDAFVNSIDEQMLIDGFIQRFGFIIAQETHKSLWDHFVYNVDLSNIKNDIEQLKSELKDEYVLDTNELKNVLKTTLGDIFDEQYLDNSYIRRFLFRSIKYALIFHTLSNPQNKNIQYPAVLSSVALIRRHLDDLKTIFDQYGLSEIEKKIRAVERLQEKFGRKLTAREIVSYVRSIKSVLEAKAILDLIC